MHIQDEVKRILPPGTHTAPVVSKKASELWRELPAEDRRHWDEEALKEKKRYVAEKEVYTGPWLVPHIRAKKDPSAPKRNSSAFLLFSAMKRKEIKKKNPDLKTTEISRMLGTLWRATDEEIKRPFVKKEEIERKEYKEKMVVWKREKEIKDKLLVQTPIDDASASATESEAGIAQEGDSKLHPVTDDLRPLGKDMFTTSQAGIPEFPWEDTTRVHDEYKICPRPAVTFHHPLDSQQSNTEWWNDVNRPHPSNHVYDQHFHSYGLAQGYSSSYQYPARSYEYQHHQHPEESHSMQYPSHRFSPISLYRNDRSAFGGPCDPVFCPIPPRSKQEGIEIPEDWKPSHFPRNHSAIFAHAVPPQEKTSSATVIFKHDPVLGCYPIGSYDELDPSPAATFQ